MDSGFLTLLETFGQPGLELELDGDWRSVLVSQNLLVVNIGEQLGTGFSNLISLQPDVVDLLYFKLLLIMLDQTICNIKGLHHQVAKIKTQFLYIYSNI